MVLFNTPKVVINVDNMWLKANLSLYHNINLLWGMSGDGKSNFISRLKVAYRNNGLDIGEYELIICSSDDIHLPTSDGKYLIIIDDIKNIFYDKTVVQYIKNARNAVFLLIIREGASTNDYSCFSEAVYTVKYSPDDGRDIFSFSRIKDNNFTSISHTPEEDKGKYVVCVCEGEDDKGEHQLYSEVFGKVFGSWGKDLVVSTLEKVYNRGYKYIYVAVDLCAYASRLLDIVDFSNKHPDVSIKITDIYCLEEVLLQTVFSDRSLDNVDTDYVYLSGSSVTFERYASALLSKHKYGECERFTKGNIPKCFKSDCSRVCNNKYVFEKCTYNDTSPNDKIMSLFLKHDELKLILEARGLI